MMMASKRIQHELRSFLKDSPCSCTAEPDPNDIFNWKATIFGPADSPFSGGVFELSIQFPTNYPFSPPKVCFHTEVFHPNISKDRGVVLEEEWNPALTASMLLASITSLLVDPNLEDPLNPEIANLYKTDKPKYEMTARSWTKEYAMPHDLKIGQVKLET